MPSDDLDLGGYEPSFIEDGQGIGQANDQLDEDLTPWVTAVRTQGADDTQDQTSSGSGGIIVQTGAFSGGYTGTVTGVTTITLDERYFLIQDNGGGEVLISLNTTDCS